VAHSTLNIMNGVKVRLQYDLSPGQKVAYRFVPVLHLNGLSFKMQTIVGLFFRCVCNQALVFLSFVGKMFSILLLPYKQGGF